MKTVRYYSNLSGQMETACIDWGLELPGGQTWKEFCHWEALMSGTHEPAYYAALAEAGLYDE